MARPKATQAPDMEREPIGRAPDPLGERRRIHGPSTQAGAQRVMGLMLGNFEELQGIPKMIALEPFRPKDRVREGHGDRRVVRADESPLGEPACTRFHRGR